MPLPRFLFALTLAAVPAETVFAASAADLAVLATMKIAEQRNYSWTTIVSNDGNRASLVLQGKTEKNGFTHIINNTPSDYFTQRYGRLIGNTVEAFMRGSNQSVIRTTDGWKLPHELPDPPAPTRNSSGRGRGGGSGLPGGNSELTMTVRQPHEDLEIIIGSAPELRATWDSFSGELSAAGASLFFNLFGNPQPEVLTAAGSFQCWIRDGFVIKYEVYVTGRVQFEESRSSLPVRWTITTELRDFGRTQVQVPPEARARL